MMNLGQRVKKLRKTLGMTQKEFASRVPGKMDYTYVGKIERGQQYPSLKLLERIGKAFSLPLSYFFPPEDHSIYEKPEKMAKKMNALLCLITHYSWLTGDFVVYVCGKCESEELCEKIKEIIEEG